MIPKRLEYKYLVPESRINELRVALMPHVDIDPYAQDTSRGNEYTVRSIYYDTRSLDAYWEKIEGLPNRKKFRIRGYNYANGSSIDFLEIKNKDGKFISKNRAPLLHENLEEFLQYADVDRFFKNENGNGHALSDAQKFLFHYSRKCLMPVILIVYDREAYQGSYDPTLRITFDKHLRSKVSPKLHQLYDETGLVSSLSGSFILEVKFSQGIPGWLRRTIARMDLRRQALSKYTICLDTNVEHHRVDMHLARMLNRSDSLNKSRLLYT